MREIIERLEALLDKERDATASDNFVAWNGEEILSALRAGQALADAWRGMDLDPRTETFWKYTDARDALLAAFPGEETTG